MLTFFNSLNNYLLAWGVTCIETALNAIVLLFIHPIHEMYRTGLLMLWRDDIMVFVEPTSRVATGVYGRPGYNKDSESSKRLLSN